MTIKIRKHKFVVITLITTILYFAVISFIMMLFLLPLDLWNDIYALITLILSVGLTVIKILHHKIVVSDTILIVPNLYIPIKKYRIKLNSIISVEKGIEKIMGDPNALVVVIKTNQQQYVFRSNYFLPEDLQLFLSFMESIVHTNLGYSN